MSKTSIGVIGDGFMATHFCNYLDYEGCNYIQWSRKRGSNLSEVHKCNTLFLLIKDSSIENFLEENPWIREKILIHFSGALEIQGVHGFHPLMTFSKSLYTHEEYRAIPFIGTEDKELFTTLLPWAKNTYYTIPRDKKPLYHALCVISGNFTSILWQKVFREFNESLNLPESVLIPYMDRVMENLKQDPYNSLTGPIKRDDKISMKKNINSLNRLWGKIYKLFRRAYKKEIK